MPDERLIGRVLDLATFVHTEVGAGMLELVYCEALAMDLELAGLRHRREVVVPLVYRGRFLGPAYRVDFVVEDRLPLEVKSLHRLDVAHFKQVRTYLRLLGMTTGFLLNFGLPSMKQGIRRVSIAAPPRAPLAHPASPRTARAASGETEPTEPRQAARYGFQFPRSSILLRFFRYRSVSLCLSLSSL